MNKLSLLLIPLLVVAVSCEKPMSEADRDAQIEREVQQRLVAERQSLEQDRLAQAQADLDAREKALAERENATPEPATETSPRVTAEVRARTTSRSASSSKVTARSYDTFYRKLEPYGAWRETNDYGYVWQPRPAQQSRNWRPYTDGRWAYTDAGWTWVSDEPFGWATYHYGRWTRLRGVGWVWVPGDEWAPAWVSWRTSDEHVGWAPLPPEARFERRTGIKKWADSYYDIGADEYVFIPNEDIGAENIGRAAIPVERNLTIVNNTTNVTNITYRNTTIVNEGPDYDRLRGRSRRPVERLRLEREYNLGEDAAPHSTVRGNVLAIMAPIFAARASERPRNVGAPIKETTVERNWAANENQAEAQRARAKMKAEATPPPDAPAKLYLKPTVAEGTPAGAATAASSATPAISSTSPSPVAAASLTPEPITTPTRRRVPARAMPTPPVEPTASAPSATPMSTATPTATATAVPSTPTPNPTVTPTPSAAATNAPEPAADAFPALRQRSEGEEGRPARGGPGEQRRARDEARDTKRREDASRMATTPTPPNAAEPVEPKAVTPAPTAEPTEPPTITEPREATPMLKDTGRRGRRAVRPAPDSATPSAEKAKADDEAADSESPEPKPEGGSEP